MNRTTLTVLIVTMLLTIVGFMLGFIHDVAPLSSPSISEVVLGSVFFSTPIFWGLPAVVLIGVFRADLLYPWSLIPGFYNVYCLFRAIKYFALEPEQVLQATSWWDAGVLITYVSALALFVVTHLYIIVQGLDR